MKASDFLKTVDNAKISVVSSANATRDAINNTSAQSVNDIKKASDAAITASHNSSANAVQLSKGLNETVARTKVELRSEATSVRTEVANSQTELDQLKKLQPEFDSMRAELAKATSDLAAQQKVISNSEEFVKQIFSAHVTYSFTFKDFVQPNNSIVIPAPPGGKNSVVFMLVPDTPKMGPCNCNTESQYNPWGSIFIFTI